MPRLRLANAFRNLQGCSPLQLPHCRGTRSGCVFFTHASHPCKIGLTTLILQKLCDLDVARGLSCHGSSVLLQDMVCTSLSSRDCWYLQDIWLFSLEPAHTSGNLCLCLSERAAWRWSLAHTTHHIKGTLILGKMTSFLGFTISRIHNSWYKWCMCKLIMYSWTHACIRLTIMHVLSLPWRIFCSRRRLCVSSLPSMSAFTSSSGWILQRSTMSVHMFDKNCCAQCWDSWT